MNLSCTPLYEPIAVARGLETLGQLEPLGHFCDWAGDREVTKKTQEKECWKVLFPANN